MYKHTFTYSCMKRTGHMESVSVIFYSLVLVEAKPFPWTCASLNGVCRQGKCLPLELYFGPLGCGKGFL